MHKRLVAWIIIALLIAFTAFAKVALMTSVIVAESMLPTFEVGDTLLINKLAYRNAPVQRGDVVIFSPPDVAEFTTISGRNEYWVKRVVAIPGDRVFIQGGKGIFVNEEFVADGLPAPQRDWPEGPIGNIYSAYLLEADECFVLGDNRDNSMDSRFWHDENGNPAPGLPLKNIHGKVTSIFWPRERAVKIP